MTAELRELVAEAVAVAGGEGPALWGDDAPVLDVEALGGGAEGGFYLVGIIGGKDVGKSALVNALAGEAISEPVGWGEGTQEVIAYAHRQQAAAVEALLEREAPGRWRMITHTIDSLRRQVLLDLPDIDSHWADHVTVTRTMLRHMLYPVWVQSVEKYADRQVQALLRQVAEGNDPANFVFVLNKVDQVARAGEAVEELREDFARRIANALRLEVPPRVYAVAATRPEAHELPELRRMLARERSAAAVKRSIEQAGRRQALSVIDWLRRQDLTGQLERLRRLEEQAAELIQARIMPLVVEEAGRALEGDAARRLELIDNALGRRARRWPLVNVLHAALWPLLAMIRANVARGEQSGGAGALGPRLAGAIQGVFAQLYQSQPAVAGLYGHRKLWEPMVAEQAAGGLTEALGRWRRMAGEGIVQRAGRASALLAPLRWLLTIGALIWFPFAQPVLSAVLPSGQMPGLMEIGLMLVRLISVGMLLQNGAFLLLWFVALWLLLRWHTQRRVDRMLERGEGDVEAAAPAAVASEWVDELLDPLRRRIERLGQVVAALERLERQVA